MPNAGKLFFVLLCFGLLGLGCGGGGGGSNPSGVDPTPQAPSGGRLVSSSLTRNADPQVPAADLAAGAAGQRAFAFAVSGAARTGSDDSFLSPFSIWQALAMTRAGATGTTALEMDAAMRTTLPGGAFQATGNRLDLALASRGSGTTGFRLRIVNAIWGQDGETFLAPFLDTLAQHYGAGLRALDFVTDPETARTAVNAWVAAQTENKILDLLAPGTITTLTRLVLTNAVYFKADWLTPFPAENTVPTAFHSLTGTNREVQMMSRHGMIAYAAGPGWQAVDLPYVGNDLAMLFVLPADGTFSSFEAGFSETQFASVVAALTERDLVLEVPRFTIRSRFSLRSALQALGMQAAFDPLLADLSGINGRRDLFIADVVHQAFVDVFEKGTEAAAATGVIIGTTAAPVLPDLRVRLDRPFLFFLRDRPTGLILFMGRVTV